MFPRNLGPVRQERDGQVLADCRLHEVRMRWAVIGMPFARRHLELIWPDGADFHQIQRMQELIKEDGFPGLQALIALAHLEDATDVPKTKLKELVDLIPSALDGDVVYDILWELSPGPLTAIDELIEDSASIRPLVAAGLLEQLVRVIEESQTPKDIEMALGILYNCAEGGALNQILLLEHTVQEAEEKLSEWGDAADAADDLLSYLEAVESTRGEL